MAHRWAMSFRELPDTEFSFEKNHIMFYRVAWLFFFCLALMAQPGCGNDGLATLTGTVTIDGELASAGIGLEFNPLQGGSPSYAQTDEQGVYEAAYTHKRMGIEPGEHRVKLFPAGGGGGGGRPVREKMPVPGENAAGSMRGSSPSGPKLPRSYYSEIMKITVEPGNNTITIPLESEGK